LQEQLDFVGRSAVPVQLVRIAPHASVATVTILSSSLGRDKPTEQHRIQLVTTDLDKNINIPSYP
jgi:hypothetical protein